MDPAFDECGEICGESGKPQIFYCESCPMKTAQENFESSCTEWLDERAPEVWKKYGFNKLLAAVLDAMRFETLTPENQTAATGKLVRILNGERNRIKRIDAWNEKQKRQNK